MARTDSHRYLAGLLREICNLPGETEWVEFKCNNVNPDEIGEYISALPNSAASGGELKAPPVWRAGERDIP